MATFALTSQIRKEAWFDNNQDVSDQLIDGYRDRAYAIIYSTVSTLYNVPDMLWSAQWSTSNAKSLLAQAEILLGAGYLLFKEYGIDQMGYDNSQAKDKIDEGKSILRDIASGKIRLFGADGLEFGRVWTTISWPVSSKPREDKHFTSSSMKR